MDKQEAIDEFLYEKPSKKRGLVSFFKTILGLTEDGEEEIKVDLNEFSEFLEDIPDHVSDEDYEKVKEVTILCSRAINIASQKMSLLSNSKSIERDIRNSRYIADLSDDDIVQLKKHMDIYMNLSKENTRLMYNVTSFNKSVSELVGKTELATKALPEIEYAEKQQKLLKADIYLIEQERSEIYEQHDRINYWLGLIDKIAITLLGIFVLITIFLMYVNFINSISVFYYIALMLGILIVSVGGMYVAKLKMKKVLKVNIKKQGRAVELLNKKNAVLAHHTNFLNYEYKKFNATSATTLRNNIEEFQKYKSVANRKTATRRALEEAESDLKEFFKIRGKAIPNIAIEKFIDMIDIENKKMHYDRLLLEQTRVEDDVERLDVEQASIWESIESIQNNTPSQSVVINDILKAYYSKLDKIMKRYKELFEMPKEEKEVDEPSDIE